MNAFLPSIHPSLYEINTRLLVERFGLAGKHNAMLHIPDNYWRSLVEKGMDYLWLMGVWQTRESGYAGCVTHDDDLEHYREALPDLTEEDLMGSPYAIDQYKPAEIFGDEDVFFQLKKKLNKKGLKLILDFVPNHFGKQSRYVESHPEHFLQGTGLHFAEHTDAFHQINNKIIAKAKDPYFPPWQDSVQVNYNNPESRKWMIEQLLLVAGQCDGVRCDMAMLVTEAVFNKTWSWLGESFMWDTEFWVQAIKTVKAEYPECLFLAECYWEMQEQLLEMGFDYCYDKSLLDYLGSSDDNALHNYLNKPVSYLSRTAHFLENHDEERARSIFALEQHISSAVFCYTIPGMRFFHDGQWEGARTRIPVQLARAKADQPCTCPLALELVPQSESRPACACIALFYQRFLDILRDDVFKYGDWSVLDPVPHGLGAIGPSPHESSALFMWQWTYRKSHVVVAVNTGNTHFTLSLSDYCKEHQLHLRAHELLSDMRIDLKGFAIYPRQAMICRLRAH